MEAFSTDGQPTVMLSDDGRTITVYAKKSRVVLYVAQLAVTGGVFAAGGVWLSSDPRYQIGAVLAAALDLLLGVFLVLGIARLVSHAPVLIVNAEGITDNASLIAAGMGMIPWREIVGLQILPGSQVRSMRILTVIADNQTILRNQALWKRALLTLARPPGGLVRIHEFLLPMPVGELQAQIEEYLRKHGHTLLSQVPADAYNAASGD